MHSIQNEIRTFVIGNFLFGHDDTELDNNESFLESGIIDSTGVLELVGFLEERFQISIDDQDLVPANLDSIDRLVMFVERKRQDKAAKVGG